MIFNILIWLGIYSCIAVCGQENAEFLIENAKLCGDPFADAIWIPVLDTCDIKCDNLSEYCVENEDLVQQCKKLPDECVKLLRLRRKNQRRQSNSRAIFGVKNRILISQKRQDHLIERSVKPRFMPLNSIEPRVLHSRIKRF